MQFETFQNVINGQLCGGPSTRNGINPLTKLPNPAVPVSNKDDVEASVSAANAAFKIWSNTAIEDRRRSIEAFSEALLDHSNEFAKLLTLEQGKPLSFAMREVAGASAWMKRTCQLELKEQVLENSDNRKVITRYTPLGVVVAIVPWNYPIQICCGKLAPALLTGNVVIIKPSPYTPYTALKIAELAQKFFPPGVVQALSGDDSLGPWLTAHPGISKISFTGSTATGKKIMADASKTLKRVTLELGGNDAAIVCSGVDIVAVAAKIGTFAFLNSGQTCIAVKRVYIHKDVYDSFRDAIVEFTKSLKIGSGFEQNTFLGPIQNVMQYELLQSFLSDTEKEYQTVAYQGSVPDIDGYFIPPTIVECDNDDARLVKEEQFGPIIPLLSWVDEDDVVNRANNTLSGLGASVWSSDNAQAERIAHRLEAGSVWINSHMEIEPDFSFGGHKESGLGVESGLSGLKAYCNEQTLYCRKS